MVKTTIDKLLDTALDDIVDDDAGKKGGFGKRRGGGGGSWRGRGARGRGRGGRGRGRGRGGFGGRVRGLASNVPSSSWKSGGSQGGGFGGGGGGSWSHDKFEELHGRNPTPRRRSTVNISTAGEIVVSGLDRSVTSDDVRDIFSQRIGVVTTAYVVFDKLGQSKGEAHVAFAKKSDARRAVQDLDQALVDKKRIRVKLKSSTSTSAVSPRPSRGAEQQKGRGFGGRAATSPSLRGRRTRGGFGGRFGGRSGGGSFGSNSDGPPVEPGNPLDRTNDLRVGQANGRGRGRGRGRGGGRRGRGRGRGRGGRNSGWGRGRNDNDQDMTAENLDAELDSYMS